VIFSRSLFRPLRRWFGSARRVALGLAAVVGLTGGLLSPAQAQRTADDTLPRAVIFSYGRFGDDAYPGSSIGLDQFEAHLEELRDGDYTVLPVPDIVAALRSGKVLPDRTVGITIDQTHASVYTEAWPRLREMGIPFTLFVTTDTVDRGGDSMSWGQIRELASSGLVTIGSLTASHPRLLQQDRAYVLGQIQRAADKIAAETGTRPSLLAWPYGEHSQALRELVQGLGYKAAFGQHSGVAHGRGDPFALPRYPMHDPYGSVDRFRLAAQTLPLLVSDLIPEDMVLDENPPHIGFTIDAMAGDLANLACFVPGVGRVATESPGSRRIELRILEALPPGRMRLNCTMPVDEVRWRWFGAQFSVPR